MRHLTVAQKTFLALLFLSAALWFRQTPMPNIGTVTYQFDGLSPMQTQHPFSVKAQREYMTVEFPMVMTRLQSPILRIQPDDCLEELSINNVVVQHVSIPFCDYTYPGREMDLTEYVHPGLNMWKMRIRDTGGDTGIRIAPALRGWVPIIDFSIVVIVMLYIASLRKTLRIFRSMGSLFSFLLVGIGVRISYVLSTGYFLRGHDTDAHIDYIRYVALHKALPAAHAGWEFHQAPLYYILSAFIHNISTHIGVTAEHLYNVIQIESIFASIGVAIVGCAMAMTLFPEKTEVRMRALFAAIILSFPTLIFLSSRITNNGLYVFLGSVTLFQFLRWWKSDTIKDWYILCALLAITALTKVSGLALVAAVGMAWVSRHGIHKDMWKFAFFGGLLFVLLFSWFPLSRLGNTQDTEKIVRLGNVGMNDDLRVTNTLTHFSTFNPVAVLEHPYNNPWEDNNRRQYFWEYFFRSAFFGEFSFDDRLRILSQGILLSAMLSLIPFLYGLLFSIRRKSMYDVPMLCTLGFLFLAAFLYRYLFPFAPNQDFRQSVLLLFPLSYFIAQGYGSLRMKKSMIQTLLYSTIMLCCYGSIAFIILLFWYR